MRYLMCLRMKVCHFTSYKTVESHWTAYKIYINVYGDDVIIFGQIT